jgi:hypothetical protein
MRTPVVFRAVRALCLSLGLLSPLTSATLAQVQMDMDLAVTGCPTTSGNNVCLTAYQGGISRRGFNPYETAITQATLTNTTGSMFQLLRSVEVNGAVYAQPLVLPNVVVSGTTHAHVVCVATEQDYVYAIDADTGNTIWTPRNLASGAAYLTSSDVNNCYNISPSPFDIGITGTPVIDISQNTGSGTITSGTLYVVAKMKATNPPYSQVLFALNIIDGSIIAQTTIGGTFNSITFDSGYAQRQNQRGALLAIPVSGQHPQIVISEGAHCDHQNYPYLGWLIAYQLSGSALNQTGIWASVPADATGGYNKEGGIWAGGGGPAADSSGNIYTSVGNGDFTVSTSVPPNDNPTSCTTSPCDYGNSILKLALSGGAFSVQDFFTPYDQATRNSSDWDTGSGGVMLLPHQATGVPNLAAQAGKEGSIYLLNTATGSMGGYNGGGTDQTLQFLQAKVCDVQGTECGIWGAPAWWTKSDGSGSTGYAYWGGARLPLRQFKFTPGTSPAFGATYTQTSHSFNWPGTVPAVSSSGTSAIVWAVDTSNFGNGGRAYLYAFDAATLNCLYTTNTSDTSCTKVAPTTDALAGIAVKFVVSSVADGKVYVGTGGKSGTTNGGFVNIYGIN